MADGPGPAQEPDPRRAPGRPAGRGGGWATAADRAADRGPAPAGPPAVGAALPPAGGVATTPLTDFKHSNFRPIGSSTTRGLGQSDAARKKALQRKYASMGINQLYSAAAANLLRAQKL